MQGQEVNAGFWWRNLTESNHLEDLRIDGMTILKRSFKNRMDDERGLDCSGSG
jgi:hypothetical protein